MKNPKWVVTNVLAKPDYTLLVTFYDGNQKMYNAKKLLSKPIYKKLNDLSFFLKAKVSYGTVIWNDDIDLSPEHLYEESRIVDKNYK